MKKPSDDRGPKLRTEMQHAHSTRTAGVRQVKERGTDGAVAVMGFSRATANTGPGSAPQCTLGQGLHPTGAWHQRPNGSQSTLAPENFTALPHLSVSSATNVAISAGVAMNGAAPRSASRALIVGSLSPALFWRLSLSTISVGVAFGAPIPNQVLTSNPGTVSPTVGTSGSTSERLAVVTAIARSLPSWTYCNDPTGDVK